MICSEEMLVEIREISATIEMSEATETTETRGDMEVRGIEDTWPRVLHRIKGIGTVVRFR
jgi:hypothetical protein